MVVKNKKYTSIKLPLNLKKKLDSLKIHPRQSYNDLIKNLIEKYG
jgi:predicted DNA-binding protein